MFLAILLFAPLTDLVSVESLLIIPGMLLVIVRMVDQATGRNSERPLL